MQNNDNMVKGSQQPVVAQSKRKYIQEETDVIGELVGSYGKWQFCMTVLLSLFQIPNTFHISSTIYQAADKDFWCERPSHLKSVPVGVWRNISNSQDNCQRADFDWSSVDLEEAMTNNINIPKERVHCTSWEFDRNDSIGNNWISEWHLVCESEYLTSVAEMFFLVGVATGGILSGYLSDKFGRKRLLFISTIIQTLSALALCFISKFEMYLALRTLLGFASVSVTYSALILAMEYVDGDWKTIAGMYNWFPLPLSYAMISGIAYLTQDFQRLQLCISIPGIFLLFLWFVIPESPRWLLVKGRIDEVKKIVEATAKFNNKPLPSDYESKLKPPLGSLRKGEKSDSGFSSLFRVQYLRRITLCFLTIWFIINLVYYGIILNMNTFGGNVYLNTALAGLVEIPAIAIAIFIILRVGKKWLFFSTLICAGLACFCATITEGIPDALWLKITFVIIGKFTISAGNTIMPVYTAELYPTAIRNAGVGACNVAAGVALISTPYLSLLNKIDVHFMMACLTAFSILGGIVVVFLPETSNKSQEEEADSK